MDRKMKLERLVVTPLAENCYVLHDGKIAAVFDPGGDYPAIKDFLEKNGLAVKHVFCTHGHFDHNGAADDIRRDYGADVMMHEDDIPIMESCALYASSLAEGYEPPRIDRTLKDGDILEFNGSGITVVHTPGHSVGGVCFLVEPEHILLSGDTLFRESVGRTDFLTGDPEALARSIKTKLYVLDDDLPVYPGHGPATSIGHEKKFNPFVRG